MILSLPAITIIISAEYVDWQYYGLPPSLSVCSLPSLCCREVQEQMKLSKSCGELRLVSGVCVCASCILAALVAREES